MESSVILTGASLARLSLNYAFLRWWGVRRVSVDGVEDVACCTSLAGVHIVGDVLEEVPLPVSFAGVVVGWVLRASSKSKGLLAIGLSWAARGIS